MILIPIFLISKTFIDRISQFSIQPPELRQLIDSPDECYRLFTIIQNRVVDEDMVHKLLIIMQDSW